jgi:hypothetical protein
MRLDKLKIFISYTHDDREIASALASLFKGALGPAVHVFQDINAIGSGDDIREKIALNLVDTDVLVALICGGQPASALGTLPW